MRFSLLAIICMLPLSGCDTRPDEFSASRAMDHQTYLPPVEGEGSSTNRTMMVQSGGGNSQPVAQGADAHDAESHKATVQAAIATMFPVGNSGATGSVTFKKVEGGIEVSGTVRQLTPGLHGFHVHEFGNLSDLETGESAGGHFNPTGDEHGPRDSEQRHAGDFGNVQADSEGTATFSFVDTKISLSGAAAIVGRGLVVHAGEDKFTQPTGDAGARVALGVIGVAQAPVATDSIDTE